MNAMTLRRKKRKGSKFLAARRLFYFSSGADGAPLPAGWSVLDQGSCGCCGECAVGSRQLLSLSNACTRARFFEPQLREPRPPKPRTGTSTASCCLKRIHAATTFGRKVAAPLLWKPTIPKFEAQNAITFTVREREPADPKLHSALSRPCRPSTTTPALGPSRGSRLCLIGHGSSICRFIIPVPHVGG